MEVLEKDKENIGMHSINNTILDENNMKNAKEILDRMNPNQKINYHTILEKLIKDWKEKNQRPKILLHSCCAPCSTYTLEFMSQYADITILFSNNNIHPKEEYEKRGNVQRKFIEDFNKRTGNNVGYIEDEYKPILFYKTVKGLEKEKEGGSRCTACFQMRLDVVAERAQNLGYDYFGSALTLSPKKNSQLINSIGLEVQEIFDVNYLPSDFKKNNGYKRSIDMCHDYDIYRQCYCGCIFAALDQGIDFNSKKENTEEFNIQLVKEYEKREKNGEIELTSLSDFRKELGI